MGLVMPGVCWAQSAQTFRERLSISKADIKRGGSMPNTFAPVVKKVLPAVVSISSARVTQRRSDPVWDELLRHYLGEDAVPRGGTQRQQQGLGSGVLVTSDGFIITNHHVINGANEITVTLPKSQRQFDAQLIAADPTTDVALLKVDGQDLPRATLADSNLAQVGDVVLAVGNPFELNQTVTQGIVSALGRSNVGPGGHFYGNFIQTDASINPGNSGGALVDSSGRVIGINSMIYSTTGASSGIGFAIPINMALKVVTDLLDEGQVRRGYLGVELARLDRTTARSLGRRDLSGALVKYVQERSPAAQAGLRRGDLIVEYQGEKVLDETKLRLAVSNTEPGANVLFGVIRRGQLIDVPVVLGQLDSNNKAYVNRNRWDRPNPGESVPVESNDVPLQRPYYLNGVELSTLDDSLREQLGLSAEYKGTVVIQVNPRSVAAQRGLQVGDVIVEVGRNQVTSTRDAYEAADKLTEDSVILGIIRNGKEQFVMIPKE